MGQKKKKRNSKLSPIGLYSRPNKELLMRNQTTDCKMTEVLWVIEKENDLNVFNSGSLFSSKSWNQLTWFMWKNTHCNIIQITGRGTDTKTDTLISMQQTTSMGSGEEASGRTNHGGVIFPISQEANKKHFPSSKYCYLLSHISYQLLSRVSQSKRLITPLIT